MDNEKAEPSPSPHKQKAEPSPSPHKHKPEKMAATSISSTKQSPASSPKSRKRRDTLRTSCDRCYALKRKCIKDPDASLSKCVSCQKRGKECVYSERGIPGPRNMVLEFGNHQDGPPLLPKRKRRTDWDGTKLSTSLGNVSPLSEAHAKGLDYLHTFLAVYERYLPFIEAAKIMSILKSCTQGLKRGDFKDYCLISSSPPSSPSEHSAGVACCFSSIATGAAINGDMECFATCLSHSEHAISVLVFVHQQNSETDSASFPYLRCQAHLHHVLMYEAIGSPLKASFNMLEAEKLKEASQKLIYSVKMIKILCGYPAAAPLPYSEKNNLVEDGVNYHMGFTPLEIKQVPTWLQAYIRFMELRGRLAAAASLSPSESSATASAELIKAHTTLVGADVYAKMVAQTAPSLFDRLVLELSLLVAELCPTMVASELGRGHLEAGSSAGGTECPAGPLGGGALSRARRLLALARGRPAYAASAPLLRAALNFAALLLLDADPEGYRRFATVFNAEFAKRPLIGELPLPGGSDANGGPYSSSPGASAPPPANETSMVFRCVMENPVLRAAVTDFVAAAAQVGGSAEIGMAHDNSPTEAATSTSERAQCCS